MREEDEAKGSLLTAVPPEGISEEPPAERSARPPLNQSHVRAANSGPISSINTKILRIRALLPSVSTSGERPLTSHDMRRHRRAEPNVAACPAAAPPSRTAPIEPQSHNSGLHSHTNSSVPIFTSHPGNAHGKTRPPHYQCIQCCSPPLPSDVDSEDTHTHTHAR